MSASSALRSALLCTVLVVQSTHSWACCCASIVLRLRSTARQIPATAALDRPAHLLHPPPPPPPPPPTGGLDTELLEDELEAQHRSHDAPGLVSLLVLPRGDVISKDKLVASKGKLVTVTGAWPRLL